jgi:indole-3-glycerol phosphate synthase
MTILDKIIAEKYLEVEENKKLISIKQLEKRKGFLRIPLSLRDSITQKGSSGIIAEFKRKSPSKGIINNSASIEEVSEGYMNAGAAGISILTDRPFFGGTQVDLMAAREINSIPILRKDFIIDEYQIIEAKAMGADAILLIAAALEQDEIIALARCAKSLGLEILFEIHTRQELDMVIDEIDLVGINNRNLKDFKVDLEHSLKLAEALPSQFVKVSESGIDSTFTINMLKNHGFEGFLIGETFMKTENPGEACRKFIEAMRQEMNNGQ